VTRALARIARATGLHILMGSGYYVAPTHPPHVASLTEREITAEIIRDVTQGVADTGIRAGVIGEIASSWPMASEEVKVFRAAGHAQTVLRCGSLRGPRKYDIFGMEVTARYPYRELGITIPSDAQRLDQIRALMDAGHGSQLLFSHDVCTKHRTRRYGGTGYDHILRDILPWMRERGFTEGEIRQPVVDNPRRAFAMSDVH
jgi:phosphotriesterase-related protein